MGELIVNPGGVKYLQNQVSNVASDVAYVIDGNKSSTAIASGNYVVLINSTISGRANGAYKAAKAIPANTVLDSSYLTAVSGGITNELSNNIQKQSISPTNTLTSSNDMNNVDVGTYRQDGTSMPSNAPTGGNNAYITVTKGRDQDRFQFWVSRNSNSIFYRNTNAWSNGSSSSWSSWEELALKSELTDLGITSSKQLTVTKNNSISTVVILAYRVGQLMFIGGYFSNTSSIANGTTIASVAPISAINPGNYACPAVQSDDNSISYLSFSYLNNLVDIKINGNLGANKYCRFFMMLPYT